MNLPEPKAGLVINFNYLWHDEKQQGYEVGAKSRPSAVIMAVPVEKSGDINTIILPISHTPPLRPHEGVPISPGEAARLGLDDKPMWIKTSEFNAYTWSEQHLRKAPGRASCAYGMLSPELFAVVKEGMMENIRRGRINSLKREREPQI